MNILAVIPARGGSKGIPRKNMRLLGGRPLVSYSIDNALSSQRVTDVIVTTDSEEILEYARSRGAGVMMREGALAKDDVTLDPVVCNAVETAEEAKGIRYDVVVTLQPTSPLLHVATLDAAIDDFLDQGFDTSISVVNRPHLAWTLAEDGHTKVPAYERRLNRQQLPPNYLETGAFVIARREAVTPATRIGEHVSVYEISEEESIDIDTTADWTLAQTLLRKKKIVFRLDGYRELGLGHVYRGLTLAYEMTGHDVVFVCSKEHREGIEKLRSCFMPVVEVGNDEEFFEWLSTAHADVAVIDQLDTTASYISRIKQLVGRVVSFEDLGEGAYLTDATVNALYEDQDLPSNFHCGERYVCLRDEFLISKPSSFHEDVRDVFVMFGGADPLDLTSRVVALALKLNAEKPRYRFDVVVGSAYSGACQSGGSLEEHGIHLHENSHNVSGFMRGADLAFTSQGRSVYELCQMAVPSIVIAQNEREQLHSFAELHNGFINLGLGTNVSDEDVERTFEWLVSSPSIRRQMHETMKTKDLKQGINRVVGIVLGEYDE